MPAAHARGGQAPGRPYEENQSLQLGFSKEDWRNSQRQVRRKADQAQKAYVATSRQFRVLTANHQGPTRKLEHLSNGTSRVHHPARQNHD